MQSLDTKKIKAIVFDMDGTLVNTTKIDLGIFNDILKFRIKNIADYFGPSVYDIFSKLHFEGKIKTEPHILVKLWHQMYKDKIKNKILFSSETTSTLKYLKKKYLLGIITGSDKYITNITLKDYTKYFNNVLTSNDYLLPKPNAESLIKISNLLNVNPDEILYVGDNYKDILFAKNAGSQSAAKIDVLYGKKILKSFCPNLIITKISELKKYL